MFLLASDSWWNHIDDFAYVLLVLIFPALAQLGKWIQGKSSESNTQKKQGEVIMPSKSITPRPDLPTAKPYGSILKETRAPTLEQPPYARRPTPSLEPYRTSAPRPLEPHPMPQPNRRPAPFRAAPVRADSSSQPQPRGPSRTVVKSSQPLRPIDRVTERRAPTEKPMAKQPLHPQPARKAQTKPPTAPSASTRPSSELTEALTEKEMDRVLTPAALRRAIILREILDSPVGLRAGDNRLF